MYETPDGRALIEVSLEQGMVWLTQQQIADLFGIQRSAITKHLNNIFKSNELEENSVSSILEHTAADGKKYKTKFYHLDAVLSVGYRVNSKNATQFRIWASTILKDYLIKGYANNEKLLREKQAQLDSLKQAVALITNVSNSQVLSGDEAEGLFRVLTDYTYALAPFTRPLMARIYIPASRRRGRTCCILTLMIAESKPDERLCLTFGRAA